MAEEVGTLKMLAKLPENAHCADCDSKGLKVVVCEGYVDPDWASINLGIFICIKCAGVHRNLGVHHSKVRSVELDTSCWDEEQINFMRSVGNIRSKDIYELYLPNFYVRPSETESPLVREHWIRAKYVRKEFAASSDHEEKINHPAAVFLMPEHGREGYLSKQSKENKWQKRWFILHGSRMSYFKDAGDSYAAKSFDVANAKVEVPEHSEAAHKYLFNIITPKRTYPITADSNDEMFDWIHAIRRASIYYGRLGKIFAPKDEPPAFKYEYNNGIIHRGWLQKQGGYLQSWNNRAFMLTRDGLYYFKNEPKIGDKPESGIPLQLSDCTNAEQKTGRKFCFSILTLERVYFLQASNANEMHEWMNLIQQTIDQCTPRESLNFRDIPFP